MKKIISSTIAALVMLATTFNLSAQTEPIENGPKIKFEKESHDYGEVKYGANGYYTFIFENTGNEPLVISHAQGSCGCTVPEWPKTPIAPGAKGELLVKYNTEKPGAINKSVTITSNAVNTPTKVIRIKGNVLPQEPSGVPVTNSGAPVE